METAVQSFHEDCQVYPYNRLSGVRHLHTSFEILIPRTGCVHARLDELECVAQPGDILVVFPGVAHSYEAADGCSGTALAFSNRMFDDPQDDWSEMRPTRPVLRLSELDADAAYCLKRLSENARDGHVREPLAQAYLSLLFVWLLPALHLEKPARLPTKDLLYRAMQYMSQNMAGPLSIRSTAHALGVNTYYLSHVLNERLHMGFRAYLNALRIDRARRYLRVTSRPIEEIAAACGFANLRTFDRVFFERCGCTPRDFRKAAAALGQEQQ